MGQFIYKYAINTDFTNRKNGDLKTFEKKDALLLKLCHQSEGESSFINVCFIKYCCSG